MKKGELVLRPLYFFALANVFWDTPGRYCSLGPKYRQNAEIAGQNDTVLKQSE